MSENINRNDSNPENISDFFRNIFGSDFQLSSESVFLFLPAYDESGHDTAFYITFMSQEHLLYHFRMND